MAGYRGIVDELSRSARTRAAQAAHVVLAQAGLESWANDAGERVSQLAEEVGQASRANREIFDNLVAAEVARAAGRVGLVPQSELDDALDRVAGLQEDLAVQQFELDELRQAVAALAARVAVVERPAAPDAPARPVKKAATRKTPAKRAATPTASAGTAPA